MGGVPILYDPAQFISVPAPHRGHERVLWRARSRMRVSGIAGDVWSDNLPFNWTDISLLTQRITVSSEATRDQIARARWVRDSYDSMCQRVALGTPVTLVSVDDGRLIRPDSSIRKPAERALEFSARAIVAGVDHITARHLAGRMMMLSGLDYIMLNEHDCEMYQQAVIELRSENDATLYFHLLTGRYGEDD